MSNGSPGEGKLDPQTELLVRKLVEEREEERAKREEAAEERRHKRRQLTVAVGALFAATLIASVIAATTFWIKALATTTADTVAGDVARTVLDAAGIEEQRARLNTAADRALEQAQTAVAEARRAGLNAAQASTRSRDALTEIEALAQKIPGAAEILKAIESQQAAQADLAAKIATLPTFGEQVAKIVAPVPSGTIAFFASSCPADAGWIEYTPLRGRYVVGAPEGSGSIGQAVGKALAPNEKRPTGEHTHHVVYFKVFGDKDRAEKGDLGAGGIAGGTSYGHYEDRIVTGAPIVGPDETTAPGTNAP